MNYPDVVNDLSCKEIISGLKEANSDLFFFFTQLLIQMSTLVVKLCICFFFIPLWINYTIVIFVINLTIIYSTMYTMYSLFANALLVVQYKSFDIDW